MVKKGTDVTPYAVSGEVDYDKLIKKFGVRKIDEDALNEIKKYSKDFR